jgi:hypothetical protein
MDDKDVRRLEDQIVALRKEAELRLEAAMARIDGSLARIGDQQAAIRVELQEQRTDGRALRTEIIQQFSEHRANEKAHFHWIMGTVVAAALAAAALVFAGFQIWGNGVQVGQTIHAQMPIASAPPSTKQ